MLGDNAFAVSIQGGLQIVGGGPQGVPLQPTYTRPAQSVFQMPSGSENIGFIPAGGKNVDVMRFRQFRDQLVQLNVHKNTAGTENVGDAVFFDAAPDPAQHDFLCKCLDGRGDVVETVPFKSMRQLVEAERVVQGDRVVKLRVVVLETKRF